MAIPSPSTPELGLAINRGHEQVCIEGIRKLRAANNHTFQRLKDINENLFVERSVVYPSPVDKNVELSQVPVAELESVAFEQTFLGPLLGIGKADVNLANVSIRKGGEDLVLKLVSFVSAMARRSQMCSGQTKSASKPRTRWLSLSLMYTSVSLSGERTWRGSSLEERRCPLPRRCSCVVRESFKSHLDTFRKQFSGKACLDSHRIMSPRTSADYEEAGAPTFRTG